MKYINSNVIIIFLCAFINIPFIFILESWFKIGNVISFFLCLGLGIITINNNIEHEKAMKGLRR